MSVAFSRVITLQAVDLIMRYAASALFSLTAWAVTAASPSSAVFRRDPWTMHDSGFPVKIDVAPSQDEVWAAEHVTSDAESDVLHVSSSVLDVSVAFPDNFSTDEPMVTMSLFEPSSSTTSDAEFEMFIDSQLQYVRQYRVELDPKKAGDRFVLRVYVEASAAHRNGTKVEESGAKLRAFYARWIDLSPSEPRFISCDTQESSSSADDAEENEEERVATRPPANMPMDMCSRFTMNGRVPVRKWYFDDQT
ncbi:unnamed protein product [Phytophthora lilii]|uniref:Unnamed protein product n=1 Tax=Phytophthora lilii TaxID=2077276 RepID=A0A9W6YHF5_9STRA|nr:unnamed protein product [Phytophthora lilii]